MKQHTGQGKAEAALRCTRVVLKKRGAGVRVSGTTQFLPLLSCFIHQIVTRPALCLGLQSPLAIAVTSSVCKACLHGAHGSGGGWREVDSARMRNQIYREARATTVLKICLMPSLVAFPRPMSPFSSLPPDSACLFFAIKTYPSTVPPVIDGFTNGIMNLLK